MEFKLVRTEYDRKTKRAYMELRTCDADGGDAIAAVIFSFATVAKLSKETLEEDLVRKARHILNAQHWRPDKRVLSMEDLSVEVRHRDLIVTMPSKGQSVTYRKQGYAPMLEALDTMRENLDAERLAFLVQAWKAAYYKAKELGWL